MPYKKMENLFSIAENIGKAVKFNISKSQINYIARIPTHATKEKSIIIGFNNRYEKEDFVAASRAFKNFYTNDLPGFDDTHTRVFINDHLSPHTKQLLTKTKLVAKERNCQFVWVKYCKIHVRKNENSSVLIINKESDLNKLN